MNVECTGEHRFFVADVATVEAEGKIVITIVCTACGEVKSQSVKITKGD
jgi:hypothetical protein